MQKLKKNFLTQKCGKGPPFGLFPRIVVVVVVVVDRTATKSQGDFPLKRTSIYMFIKPTFKIIHVSTLCDIVG